MSSGLTPRQSDALTFIKSFIDQFGWSPCLDEIAAGIGLASKSAVQRLVVALTERGFITFTPARRRSIALVTQPRPPEGIDFLPHEVAVWVRVLSARAGVSPLDVVIECVRDAYNARKKPEPSFEKPASHETSSAGRVPA